MNYEELVQSHSAELIEKLVKYVVTQEPVEILFNYGEGDQWAIISMHEYEQDLEVSIRLHINDLYELYLGYYDEDDEFFEIIKPLAEEEKKQLPEKLRILMKKVLDDEKGVRFAGHLLIK